MQLFTDGRMLPEKLPSDSPPDPVNPVCANVFDNKPDDRYQVDGRFYSKLWTAHGLQLNSVDM